jgi:sulfate adenylyltransferase
MIQPGHFLEVFVDTPLEVCEHRDTKGLYARARRGEIEHFTGVSDVYERPQHAEITLETIETAPQDNARIILQRLASEGFVRRLG